MGHLSHPAQRRNLDLTTVRTARITRRLPVATSATCLLSWAGIALIGGKLEHIYEYSWLNIPPGYVIAAAYLIGLAQFGGMIFAARPVIRIASIFGAAFYGMLTVNIATQYIGAPGWGVYLGLALLNVGLWFAPGVWRDDRISFGRAGHS
jgi:hypothetical protein